MDWLKTLLILAALMPSIKVFAGEGDGGADGGGTFEFYRTRLHPIMTNAEAGLRAKARGTPEEFFAEAFAPYKVDKQEFLAILDRIVHNPEADARFRKAPNGFKDRLMLDYTLNEKGEKQIEVLFPWFDEAKAFLFRSKTNMEQLTRETYLEKEYQRALLHEALHHFGVGISNDDEAFNYSMRLPDMGYWASKQIELCKTIPAGECIKTWQPAYLTAIRDLKEWIAGFETTGNLKMVRADGLSLTVDLKKAREAVFHRPETTWSLITECERYDTTTRRCETKRRLRADGSKLRLGTLDRGSVYLEKSPDWYFRNIEVTDPFLTIWPDRLYLRDSNETGYATSQRNIDYPIVIIKESL